MSNKRYAHVIDGQVVHVLIAPDQATATAVIEGGEAVLADEHTGIGWRYDGTILTPPPVRQLTAGRAAIVGNGTDAALVTYADTHDDAPASVVFTVNGVTKTVDVTTAGNAFLDVVSFTPGDTIQVTVDALPGATLTITVEP